MISSGELGLPINLLVFVFYSFRRSSVSHRKWIDFETEPHLSRTPDVNEAEQTLSEVSAYQAAYQHVVRVSGQDFGVKLKVNPNHWMKDGVDTTSILAQNYARALSDVDCVTYFDIVSEIGVKVALSDVEKSIVDALLAALASLLDETVSQGLHSPYAIFFIASDMGNEVGPDFDIRMLERALIPELNRLRVLQLFDIVDQDKSFLSVTDLALSSTISSKHTDVLDRVLLVRQATARQQSAGCFGCVPSSSTTSSIFDSNQSLSFGVLDFEPKDIARFGKGVWYNDKNVDLQVRNF